MHSKEDRNSEPKELDSAQFWPQFSGSSNMRLFQIKIEESGKYFFDPGTFWWAP